MLLIGILGFFLMVGGVANAIREHGNGRRTTSPAMQLWLCSGSAWCSRRSS